MVKTVRIFWLRLRRALAKIHLVDKCLILFMLILLLQSAYSLFFPSAATTGGSDIDIIVRTSSAAIFGYFLSANFIRHAQSSGQTGTAAAPAAVQVEGPPALEGGPRGQIGFSLPGPQPAAEPGHGAVLPAEAPPEETPDCRLQIVAATCVGLFCLLTLLLLRNLDAGGVGQPATASLTATVAQFRDFVSGCVGFLIGCPTNRIESGGKTV